MLKFKPSIFIELGMDEMYAEYCAKQAQYHFDKWVESLDVVYCGNLPRVGGYNVWTQYDDINPDLKARILPPEEIERKCEHNVCVDTVDGKFYCDKCFKKLKPTGWEEIE